MGKDRIAAASVGAICVVLFTALLIGGKVSQGYYAMLLGLAALVSIAILCHPRLKELDIKNLRLILADLKQTQAEIRETKAEIEEMYGGIDNLRKAPLVLDVAKMRELGLDTGHIANINAVMQYTMGCLMRERERLARVFVNEKKPDQIAQAILDGSLDDRVFKWSGPESPLDVEPIHADQRKKRKQSASE